MFRIKRFITTTKIILHSRSSLQQIAPISCHPTLHKYKPVKERETCPPPPPPLPPPPRDDRLLMALLGGFVLAGIFSVVAKDNKEIRDWLTIHAPWFDDLIAIVYQEDDLLRAKRDELELYLRKQYCLYFMKKPEPVPKVDSCCKTITGETTAIEKTKDEGPPEPPAEPTACDELAPPILIKNICEVELCIKELGESALNNYDTATAACEVYKKRVEEAFDNFTIQKIRVLPGEKKERDELVSKHERDAKKDSCKLDQLGCYFKCNLSIPKEQLEKAACLHREYQERIKRAKIELEWGLDMAKALDDKTQKMLSLMEKFTKEIQIMYPGVDYESDKPSITTDMDLFILHTSRQVKAKQQELEQISLAMGLRAERAYDSLPKDDANVVNKRDSDLKAAIAKKRSALNKSYADRTAAQMKENLDELLRKLHEQLMKHQEDLIKKVDEKEREMCKKLVKMVEDKVASEKNTMNTQRNELKSQVRTIEAKLCAHLKAESESRRSQELWACGASLMAAFKKGESRVNVEKEIKAIEKAAGEDKLVLAVLKAIPESVKKEGVVPESVLRDKYKEMEQVALNVSMVETEGGPLPVYILSWVQSMFLFMKLNSVPKEEMLNPPQEPPEGLDTFDLLQRARYWVYEGRLEIATRYVGALQGASRIAADAWYEAARAHLETRQAAEAVLAHAQALAVQYI